MVLYSFPENPCNWGMLPQTILVQEKLLYELYKVWSESSCQFFRQEVVKWACQGRIQRGFMGFSRTPLWLEISFSWEFLDKFDESGTLSIWWVWDTFHYTSLNKSILLPVNVCKIAGWEANSVDLDQTPRSAASDLGLHCLPRPVCPNT